MKVVGAQDSGVLKTEMFDIAGFDRNDACDILQHSAHQYVG
jgi:hypothetical protein